MVRIVSLKDNISKADNMIPGHGLSIYIETGNHKILFDTGPDSTFLTNAGKKGIDIADVDTVIISHGHYDHGGGLRRLTEINPNAKIYIRPGAFKKYYNKKADGYKYIGLDEELKNCPKIIFTPNKYEIDNNLILFSDVRGKKLVSKMNKSLYIKQNDAMILDDFTHEQYLVINDEDRQILMSGCSHAGIINIVDKFDKEFRKKGNVTVIGGFHLYDNGREEYEKSETIISLCEKMLESGYEYYTGHCTGDEAYNIMKEKMGAKLNYLSTGEEVIFI